MNEIPKIGLESIEKTHVKKLERLGGFDEKGLFLIGEKYKNYIQKQAKSAKLRGEATFNAIVEEFPVNLDPEAQTGTRVALAGVNEQIDALATEVRGEITTIIETPVTI